MTDLFRHILVPLDGSARDRTAVELARGRAHSGSLVTLLFVRSDRALRRLRAFADSAELTLPDAAVAYVERSVEQLQDEGVCAQGASVPGGSAAAGLTAYARRHGVTSVWMPAGGSAAALSG